MENAVEYIVQMVFFGIDHFLRTLYIKADGCEIGSWVTQTVLAAWNRQAIIIEVKQKINNMKRVKIEHLQEIMRGCIDNDYKSICQAGRLLSDLASGLKDIEAEDRMKSHFKTSLYRKFMRAYTRYILANPQVINQIAIDCSFTSMANGEYTGIKED